MVKHAWVWLRERGCCRLGVRLRIVLKMRCGTVWLFGGHKFPVFPNGELTAGYVRGRCARAFCALLKIVASLDRETKWGDTRARNPSDELGSSPAALPPPLPEFRVEKAAQLLVACYAPEADCVECSAVIRQVSNA